MGLGIADYERSQRGSVPCGTLPRGTTGMTVLAERPLQPPQKTPPPIRGATATLVYVPSQEAFGPNHRWTRVDSH